MVLAFHQRLEQLDWMDEATRRGAHTKLSKMVAKIGYPDRFADDAISIDPHTYTENALASRLARAKRLHEAV